MIKEPLSWTLITNFDDDDDVDDFSDILTKVKAKYVHGKYLSLLCIKDERTMGCIIQENWESHTYTLLGYTSILQLWSVSPLCNNKSK